jgi:hypothetical protein
MEPTDVDNALLVRATQCAEIGGWLTTSGPTPLSWTHR